MSENTRFVTIQLSRFKGMDDLLSDLQEICEATPRRAFGKTIECKTTKDRLRDIKRVLQKYELAECREGETYVYALRPWTGFGRTLSTGKYQRRVNGKLQIYGSKREWMADTPYHADKPLEQFA